MFDVVDVEVSNESDEKSEAMVDGKRGRVMMRAWLGNFAELAIFNLIGRQAVPTNCSLTNGSDSALQLGTALISS